MKDNLTRLRNVFSEDREIVWDLPPSEPVRYAAHIKAAEELSEDTHIPIELCGFVLRRFGGHVLSARAFLKDTVPKIDVLSLPGMEEAVSVILDPELSGGIGVYSDFDADGVTSAVILVEGLSYLGIKPVITYFPSRFLQGYGFHAKAVEQMWKKGVRLIITADCGITGYEAQETAKDLGCQVVITDHHRPIGDAPRAQAVLDPFLPSWDNLDLKYLSGAGVAHLLCKALFRKKGIEDQVPKDFAHDLLTLSIAGDGQALTGLNRAYVKSGLKKLASGQRPGVKALFTLFRKMDCGPRPKGTLQEDSLQNDGIMPLDYERDVMFGLVPRINAAGRMDSAYKAFELLMEDSIDKAMRLGRELDDLNSRRREEESKVLSDFSAMFPKDLPLGSQYILCAENPKWHQGVIGIACSRLRERYHRPALLLCGHEEILKGSVRGIPGFHVPKALSECRDLLVTYGGHEGAGGLSIERKNIDSFFERLQKIAEKHLSKVSLWPSVPIDEVVSLESLNRDFLEGLMSLGPFGQGNPIPCLLLPNVSVERIRLLGKDQSHLEISVKDEEREGSKGDGRGASEGEEYVWHDGKGRTEEGYNNGPSRRLIFFKAGKMAKEVSLWGKCDILFSPREKEQVNGENHSLVVKDVRPALSLLGEGYHRILSFLADDFQKGPSVLYTWSSHAVKALYVALSKMGMHAAAHFAGESGSLAQDGILALSSGGVVISDAPWDLVRTARDLPQGLIYCFHEPIEKEAETKLRDLQKDGFSIGTFSSEGIGNMLSEDSWEWQKCTFPGKESMEGMWKFLERISRQDLVCPWEIAKRWAEVLNVTGMAGIQVAPYDKYLSLSESSLSILEELAMVSFTVCHKTFFLRLSRPKETVSLGESKRFSKGSSIRNEWRGKRG